jgi:hypothetical protein
MDNATGKLCGQNGAHISFFLATTNNKQPRIERILRDLVKSSSKEVHTFQVYQSSNVAYHTVVIGPS